MDNAAPKIWLAQSGLPGDSSDYFRKQPFYIKIIPVIVLALVAGVGWITHWTVEHAMKEDMSGDLETILKADASAMRLWVADQRLASEQIALDEEIHALCLELLRQSMTVDDWAGRVASGSQLK